jgi:amidohydrolase
MHDEELVSLLDRNIAALAGKACALSDWMAANPELSGEEFESSRRIVGILSEAGFAVEFPYGDLPTAFRAVAGPGTGPQVAILVEYDALPEMGHACGHCVSGAMAGRAALALADLVGEVGGTLSVVGTPAEEVDGAKCSMADKGLFDGYDLAIMIHADAATSSPAFRSLAMDGYRFTFRGKPAHAAAAPREGVNALNGVQLLFHALDMLRQHIRPEARIQGVIDAGGAAPNIGSRGSPGAVSSFRAPTRDYLNGLGSAVSTAPGVRPSHGIGGLLGDLRGELRRIRAQPGGGAHDRGDLPGCGHSL